MTDEKNLMTDEELDKVAGGKLLLSYWPDGKGGYDFWDRETDLAGKIASMGQSGSVTWEEGTGKVKQADLKSFLDIYKKDGYTIELLDSRPKGI